MQSPPPVAAPSPTIWLPPAQIRAAEATNVVLLNGRETVKVGPFGQVPDGDGYLRLAAEDLIEAAAALRHLADTIATAVFDARDAKTAAERDLCPWCNTLIEPDEPHCGAAHCRLQAEHEHQVEAYL